MCLRFRTCNKRLYVHGRVRHPTHSVWYLPPKSYWLLEYFAAIQLLPARRYARVIQFAYVSSWSHVRLLSAWYNTPARVHDRMHLSQLSQSARGFYGFHVRSEYCKTNMLQMRGLRGDKRSDTCTYRRHHNHSSLRGGGPHPRPTEWYVRVGYGT